MHACTVEDLIECSCQSTTNGTDSEYDRSRPWSILVSKIAPDFPQRSRKKHPRPQRENASALRCTYLTCVHSDSERLQIVAYLRKLDMMIARSTHLYEYCQTGSEVAGQLTKRRSHPGPRTIVRTGLLGGAPRDSNGNHAHQGRIQPPITGG